MRRFDIGRALPMRIGMGLVALGILLPAEIAGALWVRGLSLREYLTSFANPAGAVSLVMFLVFAAVPTLVPRAGHSGEAETC